MNDQTPKIRKNRMMYKDAKSKASLVCIAPPMHPNASHFGDSDDTWWINANWKCCNHFLPQFSKTLK